MPKIAYEVKNFTAQTLDVISQANEIISEYSEQGFTLTLRQLYYQFVSRALIPNTERSYDRLGGIISGGRRAGLIDWDAIEDRTRELRRKSHWDDPREILTAARDSYHKDLWFLQGYRIEVWIEKDALLGVIGSVCADHDVPYFSCRGYVSDSEMWRAAMRMLSYGYAGKEAIVLHLGDHDPSGIDMTRDIEDRLELFTNGDVDITVKRIALNMDQIVKLNPPPNPAKFTDSRYKRYVDTFGEKSWELDALEPQYISDLIAQNIRKYRNDELWDEAYEEQESEREQIDTIIDCWEDITKE